MNFNIPDDRHHHDHHGDSRQSRGRGRGFVPGGPGNPFGGNPFEPGFGPRGFHPGPVDPRVARLRGGRNRRGQVRESILALLVEEPMNGYQVMQSLAERTQGLWRPSPGAVYPALAQLEDEGLIESFDNEGQKAFRLTETGKAAAEKIESPWEAVNEAFGPRNLEAVKALMQEVGALGGAAKELVRNGTPEQVQGAAAVVAEARRKIYGLLASDPGTSNPDDLR